MLLALAREAVAYYGGDEDAVQDVCVRVLEHPPDKPLGRSYVYRVAFTVCANTARRVATERRALAVLRDEPPPQPARRAEPVDAGDLPAHYREALSLRALGWTYSEIAELQGISTGNARVRVCRARARLRRGSS